MKMGYCKVRNIGMELLLATWMNYGFLLLIKRICQFCMFLLKFHENVISFHKWGAMSADLVIKVKGT